MHYNLRQCWRRRPTVCQYLYSSQNYSYFVKLHCLRKQFVDKQNESFKMRLFFGCSCLLYWAAWVQTQVTKSVPKLYEAFQTVLNYLAAGRLCFYCHPQQKYYIAFWKPQVAQKTGYEKSYPLHLRTDPLHSQWIAGVNWLWNGKLQEG